MKPLLPFWNSVGVKNLLPEKKRHIIYDPMARLSFESKSDIRKVNVKTVTFVTFSSRYQDIKHSYCPDN